MKPVANVDIRERIVEESIKLFLRNSFRGTPIKDITDAVGLSKGAFYWYFDTKSKLIDAILSKWEKEFLDPLIETINAGEEGFLRKFKRYHKLVSEFPRFRNKELCVAVAALAAEMAGSGNEAESLINNIHGKYRRFVEELINRGKAEGVVRDDLDSRIIAHAIIGFHNGSLLEWYTNQEALDGTVFARTYRDLILRGILMSEVESLEVKVVVNRNKTYSLTL